MSAKNKSELINEIIDKILSGGRRTTAQNLRTVLNDYLDSYPNVLDGGLVFGSEIGYSSAITPTSDYSFSTKKFTLDSIAASTLGYVPLAVDGRNANGADQDWGGYSIKNIDTLKDVQSTSKMALDLSGRFLGDFDGNAIVYFGQRATGLGIYNSSGWRGDLRFSALSGSNKTAEFPDKNITVAGLDDLSGYIPLIGGVTLTGDITVAADVDFKYGDGTSGSSRITPFRSSTYLGPAYNNIVSFVKAGGTELSPNVIAGMWQSPSDVRLQAVDLTANGWNEISVSSAGIGFHTDFSNAYYSYFRADNLTGNKTVQLPNFSGTIALSEQTVNLTGTQASIAGEKTFTNETFMLSLKVLKFGGSSAVPTDYINALSSLSANTLSIGPGFTSINITANIVQGSGSNLTIGKDILFRSQSAIRNINNIPILMTSVTVASAVNYITLSNSATGNAPSYVATGTDTNIGLSYSTKGTGIHKFNNDIEITDSTKGIIQHSPDNAAWRLAISNAGVVTAVAV